MFVCIRFDVCVCMVLCEPESFKLYFTYPFGVCWKKFVFFSAKNAATKFSFFGSESTSNFLKCILIAFRCAQRFFWQNSKNPFAILRGLLNHFFLRTESHEPSCLLLETDSWLCPTGFPNETLFNYFPLSFTFNCQNAAVSYNKHVSQWCFIRQSIG